MKPLSFSVLLLLTVLLTGSCKKIPVIDKTNNAENSISFKIDGVTKEAKGDNNVFAFYSKEESALQIVGNLNAAGEQIGLTIGNFHGVGEYTTEEAFLGIYNTPEIQESIIGTEGKIKITEFIEGKNIKGEFEFKGAVFIISPMQNGGNSGIKIFSGGKFTAKITTDLVPTIAAQ